MCYLWPRPCVSRHLRHSRYHFQNIIRRQRVKYASLCFSPYLVFGDSDDVTREIFIYDSKLGILEKGRPGKVSIEQPQIGEAGEIFRFLRASLILADAEFCKWRTFFRKAKEEERERERKRRKVDQANASPSFNEWNAVFRRYIFFQPTVADESFQPSGNCDSADFAVALPSTLPPSRPRETYEKRHRSDRDGKMCLGFLRLGERRFRRSINDATINRNRCDCYCDRSALQSCDIKFRTIDEPSFFCLAATFEAFLSKYVTQFFLFPPSG